MTTPNEIHTILKNKHTPNALLTACLPAGLACTKNFLWCEFVKSQREIPALSELESLYALAHTLQALRDNVFHSPMIITSGWRSKAYNKQIGGATGSYHTKGMACDFQIKGLPSNTIYNKLSEHSGGLGLYKTFIHLDIGPKRRWSG